MTRPLFELVKFAPGHVDRYGDELVGDSAFMLQGHQLAPEFAWTAFYGERCAGMGCLTRVGEAWGFCGIVPAKNMPLDMWRAALPALHRLMWQVHTEGGVRRLDTVVLAAFPQGHRLVTRLGFQFRGDHTGWDGTSVAHMLYSHISPRLRETEAERDARLDWHQAMLDRHAPGAVRRRHMR
jgi:hypothetical protein